MELGKNNNQVPTEHALHITDVRQRALDWWSKLPMFNMDKPCKRMLAARHYKTEQSFLTDEQIEFIWQQEHVA